MVLLQSSPLPIGTFSAPELSLPGTDGKHYILNDFWPLKGLLVVFTCNHCPYAQALWPLLIKTAQEYKIRGIETVAINPNDETQYPDDSFDAMKKKVKEWNIPFPYLRDGMQTVAQSYKAVCTPDIYLFDEHRVLYYHGRFNDRWQDQEKVTRHDLRDAIEALLAGSPPPKEQIPSMGCSIKWKI